MPQLALYLDETTAKALDEAAAREGLSRSAWVRRNLRALLDDRLPPSFFEVLGTWDDDREPDQILEEIRAGQDQPDRPPLL